MPDADPDLAPLNPTVLEAIEKTAAPDRLVHMRWSHGELGRPGDNLYQVTFVAVRPHKLIIEFDELVLAVLTEPRLVRASDAEVITAYEQLTIDRQGFGDMTPSADSFGPGQFTIYRQGM